MFIKNPFKTNVIVILLLNSLVMVHSQGGKTCFGAEPRELPDGCIIVGVKPLVFRGNEDDSTIRQKLKDIKEVQAGIEIIGTDYESFDFFNATLEALRNPDGPALVLRENKKLKRIQFAKLKEISGKDNIVLLDKTDFSSFASEDGDSLQDLLRLEVLVRSNDEKCSSNFAKVIPFENEEDGGVGPLIIWIAFAVFMLVLAILIIVCLKKYSSYKKLKAEKEAKNKKDAVKETAAEVEKKTGDEEEAAEKVPSIQGNEDSKNK